MSKEDLRLSFEFFPSRTDAGKEKLIKTRDALVKFNPEFFSMTYGAGGSTRDSTARLVTEFNQAGVATAPHLSFGGDSEETIKSMLDAYKAAGVNRIVALRGDTPSGSGYRPAVVYASQLVEFIRQHFGDHFHLEVAAYPEIHPEAKTYDDDVNYFGQKVEAGADSAITQYFYNLDAYQYFVDNCKKQGIDSPIYPGIMPIINFDNLKRFSQNCGAEIPRWLSHRIESLQNDPRASQEFCSEFVTRLCEQLLAAGAPGIHFYTMNQVEPVQTICANLGLSAS